MLVSEYYQRTTWKERLFNRIAFGYRGMQREEAEDQAQRQQDHQAAMRNQMSRYNQGRP